MQTHTMVWNERRYFDDLMKQEGKTVEVLENQCNMEFENFDIIITMTKRDNGNWYWDIQEPTGKYNHPDRLPILCKGEYHKFMREIGV